MASTKSTKSTTSAAAKGKSGKGPRTKSAKRETSTKGTSSFKKSTTSTSRTGRKEVSKLIGKQSLTKKITKSTIEPEKKQSYRDRKTTEKLTQSSAIGKTSKLSSIPQDSIQPPSYIKSTKVMLYSAVCLVGFILILFIGTVVIMFLTADEQKTSTTFEPITEPPFTGPPPTSLAELPNLTEICRTENGYCWFQANEYRLAEDCMLEYCMSMNLLPFVHWRALIDNVSATVYYRYNLEFEIESYSIFQSDEEKVRVIVPEFTPCSLFDNQRGKVFAGWCVNKVCKYPSEKMHQDLLKQYEGLPAIVGGWDYSPNATECISPFKRNKQAEEDFAEIENIIKHSYQSFVDSWSKYLQNDRCTSDNACMLYSFRFRSCTNPRPQKNADYCWPRNESNNNMVGVTYFPIIIHQNCFSTCKKKPNSTIPLNCTQVPRDDLGDTCFHNNLMAPDFEPCCYVHKESDKNGLCVMGKCLPSDNITTL